MTKINKSKAQQVIKSKVVEMLNNKHTSQFVDVEVCVRFVSVSCYDKSDAHLLVEHGIADVIGGLFPNKYVSQKFHSGTNIDFVII